MIHRIPIGLIRALMAHSGPLFESSPLRWTESLVHLKAINQTSMKTMLCSAEVVPNLLECKPQCPTLDRIIQMEPVSDDLQSRAQALGIRVLSFAEIVAEGESKPLPLRPPSPKDIATLCS